MSNSQIPGWVWFFTGLVTGLFLALLIYLGRYVPVDTQDTSLTTRETAPARPTSKESEDMPFQFYDIFEKSEVPVEERSNEPGTSARSRYVLQTGSFANAEDADRMRAQLLLLGLDVFTRQVSVHGELRHRVLVGPLDTRGELNKALDKLAQAEIESIALKVPAGSP